MDEIRIPTDQIPPDVLYFLKSIGRPVSNSIPSSSPSSATPFYSLSKTTPVLSSSSQSTSSLESDLMPSTSLASCPSQIPVATFASTTPRADEISLVDDRRTSYNNVFPSSRKSPFKRISERREESRLLATVSAAIGDDEGAATATYYADEVDGGDGIVHAFSNPQQLRQTGCFDAIDDSDVVHIFPQETSSFTSAKTTVKRFPSDDSDIIQIFPKSNDEGSDCVQRSSQSQRAEAPSKRGDIVRALSPNKQSISSSMNFQLIEEDSCRMTSPGCVDDRCVSPRVGSSGTHGQFKTSPPKQQTPKKDCLHDSGTSRISPFRLAECSPLKSNKLPSHNNRHQISNKISNHCMMNVLQKDNNLYVTPKNLVNSSQSQAIAAKNNLLRVGGEMSPSKSMLNIRREMTPKKCIRLSPPDFGRARRSPAFPTPPETPDDADVSEDEVFSYDDVFTHDVTIDCQDSDSLRQNVEFTPRKDVHRDLRTDMDMSPSYTGPSGGKRTSPFSPGQALADMNFGDRQQTRKRLSFEEDDVTSSSQNNHNAANPFSDEISDAGRPEHDYLDRSTNRVLISPKRLQPSPVGSPFCTNTSAGHSYRIAASPHFKTVTSPTPIFYSPHSPPKFSCSTNSPEEDRASQYTTKLSFQRPPVQSPVQDTFTLIERALATQDQGQKLISSRIRIRSDGDDVTDGEFRHASSIGHHQRSHTFSSYSKRRRIGRDDDLERTTDFTGSSQTCSLSKLPSSTSATSLTSLSSSQPSTVTSASSSSSSSSIPSPKKIMTLTEEVPTAPCDCACVTVERNVLKMAADAYERIRRLDAQPDDYKRFRQELAQTNDMLLHTMAVVKNIKAMCSHDKQKDKTY